MRLTDFQINEAIEWIKSNDIPHLFQEQFKDFIVKDNRLIYEPLNLQYVAPREKLTVMEDLYNQVESAGKGQNNFYRWLTSKYLGITKREAAVFIKSKEDYQLTRDTHRSIRKPIISHSCFQIFAIDLVDLNQYVSVKANKHYRYVLSIMDLFSGYCWFQPIKKKEPTDVLNAFLEAMAETGDNLPSRVLSDNGTEFKGEFEDFLKENKIKHICTKSYTPEPHIEASNNQLRKIMRQVFVRNNSLAWLPHLAGIQTAKNTQWNANHNAIPDQIMTQFETDTRESKKYLKTLSKNQSEFYKNRIREYDEDLLHEGNYVRIKLAATQSQLRQKIKAGNKKLIVVRFSPDVFKISEIRMPKQNRIGFPKYIVEDLDGNTILQSGKTYPILFNRYDLLKVGVNQRAILSSKNANTLNRLNNPQDILEQEPAIQPVVAQAIPIARAEKITKSVTKYVGADWNRELKGKEFSVGRKKYVILNVEYIRSYKDGNDEFIVNNWVVDVVERENFINNKSIVPKKDRRFDMLYYVLSQAKKNNENWYVQDYDEAIKHLEDKDKK